MWIISSQNKKSTLKIVDCDSNEDGSINVSFEGSLNGWDAILFCKPLNQRNYEDLGCSSGPVAATYLEPGSSLLPPQWLETGLIVDSLNTQNTTFTLSENALETFQSKITHISCGSYDNYDWEESSIPASSIRDITHGGVFVAVGGNEIFHSQDGKIWTEVGSIQVPEGTPSPGGFWTGVAYGNYLFVAVGLGSGTDFSTIIKSEDGVSWSVVENTNFLSNWNCICYGGGKFVAIGGTIPNVATSSNGLSWSVSSFPGIFGANSVAYGNGTYVAISQLFEDGEGNELDQVFTSPDGINWTPRNASEKNFWNSVAFGSSKFVAISGNMYDDKTGLFDKKQLMISSDGITWSSIDAPVDPCGNPYRWSDIDYGNGRFYAISLEGAVMTSLNGTSWEIVKNGTPLEFGFNEGFPVAKISVNRDAFGEGAGSADDWTGIAGVAGLYWNYSFELNQTKSISSEDCSKFNSLAKIRKDVCHRIELFAYPKNTFGSKLSYCSSFDLARFDGLSCSSSTSIDCPSSSSSESSSSSSESSSSSSESSSSSSESSSSSSESSSSSGESSSSSQPTTTPEPPTTVPPTTVPPTTVPPTTVPPTTVPPTTVPPGTTQAPGFIKSLSSKNKLMKMNHKQNHNLAVICFHWNPAGWRSLRDNYLRFRHEMHWWNVPTFAAEVAYEGQSFPTKNAFVQIRARQNNIMWQKERLINLISEKLPEEFDRVAWVDSDVIFLDRNLIKKIHEKLDENPVVQLWNKWHCVNKAGAVGEVLNNVGKNADTYKKPKVQSSPGGAWAVRREVLPIYDRHVVGSGDAMLLEAWIAFNEKHRGTLVRMNQKMIDHYMPWKMSAYEKVKGKIGVLDGDAIHLNHGTRANRLYVERWKPLFDLNFDPEKHVEVDESGLLAWTDLAPKGIVDWVANYFVLRNEDES